MTARYAVYFAPHADTAWARFGERALVGDARRYGMHATLKAPFRLAAGSSVEKLIEKLDLWCATQTAFVVPALRIAKLDDFRALVPVDHDARIDAIAEQCVRRFDGFRAPSTPEELGRRRMKPLSIAQEALLLRWGYPHVLEEFRFHISLSGPLAPHEQPDFGPLPSERLVFDAVSLFEEPAAGAAFRLRHRARFRAGGRLIYVAGPSGAGKDSILDWAKARLHGRAAIVFARRTITRPLSEGGERHIPCTREEFDERHARGEFVMSWEANGHHYGIGQEIVEWLARGRTVIVSGSREYLPRALLAFPDMEVVHVTAPAALLRERLIHRRREGAGMVERRLARSASFPLSEEIVSAEVVNDGDVGSAGRRFLEYVLPLSGPRAIR